MRLETYLSLNNMHLYEPDGQLKRYTDPREIIEDFVEIRLAFYEKRRQHQMRQLEQRAAAAAQKGHFLELMTGGAVEVAGRETAQIIDGLRNRGVAGTDEELEPV